MKTRNKEIQAIRRILDTINGEAFYFNGNLDQRGIGSLMELYTQEKFQEQELFEYKEPTSVRSIDDFTLKANGHTYLIDVKTHDKDRKFSMPNLISTERLYKLYQDPNVTFCIMILDYETCYQGSYGPEGKEISNTRFVPIESISWESLSIQNLGNGQIQITNLNKNLKLFNGSRQTWLSQLGVEMVKYHDKLEMKLKERKNKWIKRSGELLMDACSYQNWP